MSPKLIAELYASLYLIRRTEEEIIRVYPSDKIKSPVHLSIGQEFVSAGVCAALRQEDKAFGTYRSHALYLAKRGSLKKMIAELYGKSTGCAKGKGGSMHLIDTQGGLMCSSAIVATTIPLAVGYALGLKYKHSGALAVCFFGDGAVDEGAFHESLNFAALKRAPVLFVCENNLYAIHSHHLRRHHSDNITERAHAYGMPAKKIESGDIFEIYDSAKSYIQKIRRGSGPAFLECVCSRWKEHVGPADDFHLGYRNEAEVRFWKKRDQLKRLRGYLSRPALESIEAKIEKGIKEAFRFAEQSPFPKEGALYQDLFKK